MPRPYVCHKCGQPFDLLPSSQEKKLRESLGVGPNDPIPDKVHVKCPHCDETYIVSLKHKLPIHAHA